MKNAAAPSPLHYHLAPNNSMVRIVQVYAGLIPVNFSRNFFKLMGNRQSRIRGKVNLLVLSTLFLCSSCNVMHLTVLPGPAKHTQAHAEQLFINGDFENAILEYEQIYETALSSEDKNHALYGLACTQLMLAQTEEHLIEAIGNLQKWNANKGSAPFSENRHLLILSLKQQSELIEEKSREQVERESQQAALIDNQKKKISQMVATVIKLESQINELHNQLKALEALDENVQQKRKSL